MLILKKVADETKSMIDHDKIPSMQRVNNAVCAYKFKYGK